MSDDKRRSPRAKPMDYILQNRTACQKVLEHLDSHSGKVLASELRDFARQHTPTDAYRNDVLNALWIAACVDKSGEGKDRSYVLTIHGKDLLESFRKVK